MRGLDNVRVSGNGFLRGAAHCMVFLFLSAVSMQATSQTTTQSMPHDTLLAMQGHSDSQAQQAREFFEQYVLLSTQFDQALVDLYSDYATISLLRSYPDGQQYGDQVMGQRWKKTVSDMLPLAKEKGDVNRYEITDVVPDGQLYKIRAHRYSVLHCYKDRDYYAVVGKDNEGKFKILSEYFHLKPLANCHSSGTDLPDLLAGVFNMFSPHYPKMLNDELRIDSIAFQGDTFEYFHTIVNARSDQLDLSYLSQTLRSVDKGRACNVPELRLLLNKEGKIKFTYADKDNRKLFDLSFTKHDCLVVE